MIYRTAFISLLLYLLAGCAVTKPDSPSAHNVFLSNHTPPENCHYIGQVYSSDGNWFTGIFTPNINILISSMNRLKNQAADNHANYVKISSLRANDAAFLIGGNNNVTINGEAYYCSNLKEIIANKNHQLKQTLY